MKHTKKKRILHLNERKQRGCAYCLHVIHGKFNGSIRLTCPFDKCPYQVLEKYKTYEEFMASEDCKILVDEFFQTATSDYELGNGNIQILKMFSGCLKSVCRNSP